MYLVLLTMHAWVRWAVVIAGVLALLRAARRRDEWTRTDTRVARVFVGTVDLQMTLGLILYLGVSPFAQAAFANMASAMHNDVLRFWGIEHITGMIVAVSIVHIGHVRSRRPVAPALRHRSALRWFGAGLAVMLVTIPWPFLVYGRPLLRW